MLCSTLPCSIQHRFVLNSSSVRPTAFVSAERLLPYQALCSTAVVALGGISMIILVVRTPLSVCTLDTRTISAPRMQVIPLKSILQGQRGWFYPGRFTGLLPVCAHHRPVPANVALQIDRRRSNISPVLTERRKHK